MQQSSAGAATALYDNAGPGVSGGDAGDAVMARWLQSAGLQHLASPMASNAVDHRLLPNLLMQVKSRSLYRTSFLQSETNYFICLSVNIYYVFPSFLFFGIGIIARIIISPYLLAIVYIFLAIGMIILLLWIGGTVCLNCFTGCWERMNKFSRHTQTILSISFYGNTLLWLFLVKDASWMLFFVFVK